MSNYTPTGNPLNQTRGISSSIRSEFNLIATAVTSKGDLAGQTWAGVHDFTGGSVKVPVLAYGSTGSYAVSMDTLNAAVFAAANLPAQVSNAGKFLATNGSIPSWAYPASVALSPRTSNTILAATDRATFIDITSGTFTQTIAPAATLGAGWYCWYRNSSTGVVTHDPNANETIDALLTRNCYPQECIMLFTDGVNFYTEVIHPFYFKSLSTVNFVMPSGYLEIESDLTAGGGGGGSGRRGAAGVIRSGGAPGGAPGRVVRRHRNIAAGTSITLTIGAAGTGGAAQTVDNTTGNNGTSGGNTSFGSLSIAYGGAAGAGGGANSTLAATSGSGSLSSGASVAGGAITNGGQPNFNGSGIGIGGSTDNFSTGGAGTNSTASNSGSNSEWGGAGSAYGNGAGTGAQSSGSSLYGVSAAGLGGNISSGDTMPAIAGTAGLNGTNTAGGGAPGGTCGASPTVGTAGAAATTDDACGNSGGGGGSSITAAAAAGGAGGFPGGAGGGGGAALNGFNSGPGGVGAAGRGIIKGIV